MARGWESKSVEDQVAEKAEASSNAINHREAKAALADRQRQRQALELQRERILDERTSSPLRRAALEAALADIEGRLKDLS
jgi:DNA-binding helix-hairpin-helix protein with protein kinase domain